MKKKYLLLTFLALAIITSLTAGTLAIYTSSSDVADYDVQAKQFVFVAASSGQFDKNTIKLAPTESQKYAFRISNYNDSAIAEVPLQFTVNIDFRDAVAAMPGLSAVITEVGANGETIGTVVEKNIDGSISFTPEIAQADTKTEHQYVVTLNWADGTDTQHTISGSNAASGALNVKVAAQQHIGD